MIVARFFRTLEAALQGIADLGMIGVDAALAGARWCGDRAREWDPRLWDRGGDDRSEHEERWP